MIAASLFGAPSTAAAQSITNGTKGDSAGTTRSLHSPKLVVVLIIDQFRSDYLTRFHIYLSRGGFNRFAAEGAVYPNAAYQHGVTATGPDHACISTGAMPRVHGIAANNDITYECTDDAAYRIVGLSSDADTSNGGSANRLQCLTMADGFRAASPDAMIVSFSLKRRGAILLAGKSGLPLWFETQQGRFVTSTAFAQSLPAWVTRLNEQPLCHRYFGEIWERALPESAYALCSPDDDPVEQGDYGLGRTFPHWVNGGKSKPGREFYKALHVTPFGNELLIEMATNLLADTDIGRDDHCDLLTISLSANDYIGHRFGPESHEVMDVTIRTDRLLETFFKRLDRYIGKGNYTVVLTSDHGVAPVAQRADLAGFAAGIITNKSLVATLNTAVRDALHVDDEKYEAITSIDFPWVHLNQKLPDVPGASVQRMREICRDALLKQRGVSDVFLADALAKPLPGAATTAFQMAWQAYHPALAGDLYVRLNEYWQDDGNVTNHGTMNEYDRRVPVMFVGAGIRRAVPQSPADPISIAPTVLRLIGAPVPGSMAAPVFTEALVPSAPKDVAGNAPTGDKSASDSATDKR